MKDCANCAFCKFCGSHAHWLLRLAVAGTFLYHGVPKFQNLAGTAEMLGLPVWVAALVALAEVGGSVLLLAGGFWRDCATRLGGFLLAPVMIGAIWMVHWGQWSFLPSETHPLGGMEFQALLLAVTLFFAFKGNSSGGGCGYSCKK